MDCKTCEELISDSLDTKADISPEIQEHLDECKACKAFHDAINDIDVQLRREIDEAPSQVSEGFHERLMAKLESAPAESPEPKTFPWLAYAAAAILALALIGLLLNLAIGPGTSGNGNTLVDNPDPAPESEVVEVLAKPAEIDKQFSALDAMIAERTEEVYLNEVDNIKEDISQAAEHVLARFR